MTNAHARSDPVVLEQQQVLWTEVLIFVSSSLFKAGAVELYMLLAALKLCLPGHGLLPPWIEALASPSSELYMRRIFAPGSQSKLVLPLCPTSPSYPLSATLHLP